MQATSRHNASIHIIRGFTDYYSDAFEAQSHKEMLQESNIIFHETAKDVSYPLHWTPLSIKCAFNGQEKYVTNGMTYSVHDRNYLIFNEGRLYSSHIQSDTLVESFTISFHANFVAEALGSLMLPAVRLLDNPDIALSDPPQFMEKLYAHDNLVTPVLQRIRDVAGNADPLRQAANTHTLQELLLTLLERMCLGQHEVASQIAAMHVVKAGTKAELYKRLHRAKDLMDSCYEEDLELSMMADVACLSAHYFLRQFKKQFGVTPHQYLINKRLDEARILLKTSRKSVTEICYDVGYSDLSSFGRLFKSRYQLSPEQYSDAHKTKKSIFAQ